MINKFDKCGGTLERATSRVINVKKTKIKITIF